MSRDKGFVATESGIGPLPKRSTRSRGPGARYHRSMLLALDIGNTNVTLGLVSGETIIASRRAATRSACTADELELLLDGMLHLDGASLADVTGISLASVVPALTGEASSMAERRGLPLMIATAGNMPMPIRVAASRPRSGPTAS